MNRYKPVGWRNESYRHSLAAKGIRTSFTDIPVKDIGEFIKDKEEKQKVMFKCDVCGTRVKQLDHGFADLSCPNCGPGLLERIRYKKRKSMAVKEDPFKFQNENQEKIVHKDWFGPKEDLYKDNELRFVLEGSGDIFREFSIHRRGDKKSDFFAQDYVDEKARRIKKYLISRGRLGGYPVDEVNRDKIENLKRLWAEQPYETKLQKKAIDLNLAILNGNNGIALSILKGLSKV